MSGVALATGRIRNRRLASSCSLVATNSVFGKILRPPAMQEWFGNQVQTWRHLRTYHIPYALPAQSPPALSSVAKSPRKRKGIWLCGDYLDTASIQDAMVSGRRAAEDVLQGSHLSTQIGA